MDKRYFSDKVVEWYEQNKRDLPWRVTKDPYKIWLAEIILQQTRVIQGLPYYKRFLERFSTINVLAAASEQEILRLWQGLGYYSRARNLHKCAQEVVNSHQSSFPDNFNALRQLRGIGDYTAAAIASFAFKEKVAVVDGNVFRVLSRVFGIDVAINNPQGKKIFTELANTLIPDKNPDVYNQAIMEFGALFCTPKNPQCPTCALNSSCVAAKNDLQGLLPVKIKSKSARKRYFYYFVVKKGKSLLMKKREEKDIWLGLFDFFLVEKQRPVKPENLLEDINSTYRASITIDDLEVSALYKHVLSHQIIFSRFLVVNDLPGADLVQEPLKFYSTRKIAALPKPVLISRFLTDYQLL